jgi:competence protein ComEC
MNPGGFDYEGWLYRQGIRATGYERDTPSAKPLPSKSIAYPIGHLRQAVAKAIARRLNRSPNIDIITARAMGEGGDMDAQPMGADVSHWHQSFHRHLRA